MSLGAQQAGEQTACKPLRIHLTSDQARKIFLYTLKLGQNPSSGIAVALAKTFGVSVKKIRDIWNCDTCVKATRTLWTQEEHQSHITAEITTMENAAAIKSESEDKGKEPTRTVPRKRSLPDDEAAEHTEADTRALYRDKGDLVGEDPTRKNVGGRNSSQSDVEDPNA